MRVRPLAAAGTFRQGPTAGRAPMICAAAFVGAAAAIAAVHVVAPITRGWWLVAYLSLVGGLSQLLLFAGVVKVAGRSGARIPSAADMRTRLVLWNVGTLIVAVMDVTELPVGVAIGGGVLVVALALFAHNLHDADVAAPGLRDRWVAGYALLLIALGCSVAIGVALAG